MFVDRDGNGNIIGRYTAQQRPGQEQLADNDPALLLITGKVAALVAIDAAATAAAAAGFTWNAAAYRIDTLTQQQISALGSIAMGVVMNVPGLAWPQGFAWVTLDGTPTPFAAADFLAFAQAAALRVTALVLNARGLKDAVTAATTAQALAAVDPSKGW
jgi:hypothetical protein